MLRMNFWPWTFMIFLGIITVCFLIFKLELRWKTMFSIACINHMPCLSTVTAAFRSISEVNFKLNSTLQNRLVRWGLHPLINYWKTSSLVDVGSSTKSSNEHSNKEREYNQCLNSSLPNCINCKTINMLTKNQTSTLFE